MRIVKIALFLLAGACSVEGSAKPYHLIPGVVPLDKGPDGNSIVLDAPRGLIVFDTGRHPEHVRAILNYAKARGRPIAAVVNSHWHLDHTTGNWDIRRAFPNVRIYASSAINGALATFLKESRDQTEKALADPKTSPATRDQLERAIAVVDHPERIKPNRIVTRTGHMTLAGRTLDVHLAKFAATEGDVWIYDPKAHLAIVGDLVVDIVPFMDTACPDGWARALNEIAATPFRTLIPGHGPVMDRSQFLAWQTAYNNFVACGRSKAPADKCIEGWQHDAREFIDAAHRDYVKGAAGYYLDTRLRSSPAEQQKYCKPLKAP